MELVFETIFHLFWRILVLTAVGAIIGLVIGGIGWSPYLIILSIIGFVSGIIWQCAADGPYRAAWY